MTEESTADSTASPNQEVDSPSALNDFLATTAEDEDTGDDTTKEEPKEKEETVSIKKYKSLEKKYGKLAKDQEKLRDIQKKAGDKKELSDEEKKEKQAQDFIQKEAIKAVEARDKATKEAEKARINELSEELDEVLDEQDDFTEDEILTAIEKFAEMGVSISPRQAVKVLKQPSKKAKEKPVLPKSTRGDGTVKTEETQKETQKGGNFHEKLNQAIAAAKDRLTKS